MKTGSLKQIQKDLPFINCEKLLTLSVAFPTLRFVK